MGFHPLKTTGKKTRPHCGSGQNNSEENLDKDSLHFLLMFSRD